MTDLKKLEQIENKINTISSNREKEIEELQQKIDAEREKIKEADKIRTTAEETMNMEMYKAARRQKIDAQDAIDLYSARLKILETKEDIQEPESDKVIDELLQIQGERDAAFDTTAGKLIGELDALLTEYEKVNNRIESALTEWHCKIKPNRRPCGVGSYHGEPQPVHALPGRSTWMYKQLARFAINYKNSLSYRQSADTRY